MSHYAFVQVAMHKGIAESDGRRDEGIVLGPHSLQYQRASLERLRNSASVFSHLLGSYYFYKRKKKSSFYPHFTCDWQMTGGRVIIAADSLEFGEIIS